MSGDRWLFPVLIVLTALLVGLWRVANRQTKASPLQMPATGTGTPMTKILVAGVCILGIAWLIPWSTHITEISLPGLWVGIVFVGILYLGALVGTAD